MAANAVLSGCLMGEPAEDTGDAPGIQTELSGSVGDGPIVSAFMRVLTADGAILSEFQSDATGAYRIMVSANENDFPLVIDAWGGTDLVTGLAPDFALRGAAVLAESRSTVNINPYSTLAIETALDLPGGLSGENVETAQSIVVAAVNGGMTTLLGDGPMFTPINGGNIAEIVRASESLAEIVRRTRNWKVAFGFSTNADLVMEALGSDLTDLVIDGVGGSRADARAAALSTVLGAQVLLESMSNELHVNGTNATAAMEAAIRQVSSGPIQPELGELRVTAKVLQQVRTGLTAAAIVSQDNALTQLRVAVSGIQPGFGPDLVKSLLPANYRQTLENLMPLVAGANASTLAAINEVARTGGSDPDVNRVPVISGTPASTVAAGAVYSFAPTASDADGDALTFSIVNRPAWMSFASNTGVLTGTPSSANVGNYGNISIRVTDGQATASLPAFSIRVTVASVNSPPAISGTPQGSVQVGSAYAFTPAASDPDGDPLTFSVAAKPTWLNFNSTNGRLTGTPAASDAGIHGSIVVSVSDGNATTSLPAFSIFVTTSSGNSPPTISGTPPTSVNANSLYSFTPTASDPDGDSLTFTVNGLPGWASFTPSTGRISGTPRDVDIGNYSGIRITVSDGIATTDLGPFTIAVQAVSTGSVTLSWIPPTENEDGTPLTDLAGYRFLWGTTPGNYPNSVTVGNPGLTSYVIGNLPPGTYEFVALAYSASGIESQFSSPATRTVP
ncbi:MAG: putative Ig domain-containing protein [Gammaproteobacteria bacterium]|nr:putative Ig domain-containing protein [Gammaproteobacteria bacterium]MDH4315102.1 putative Ig domain-containing protein [Gammaproteobacteria bacterium]MDH5214543.1 putative Ig domain-containing protein [Gammaproteobacteria bacterium]